MLEVSIIAGLAGILAFLYLIFEEGKRRNRLLNQLGYHLVELHNVLERRDSRDIQKEAFFESWNDL